MSDRVPAANKIQLLLAPDKRSFYLRIPIGQTDLFQGTEQVKAIVEGSLDQRRIPNNLDTEDSNAALHPFFELKATHILSANLFFTSNCFKTRR